MSRTTASLATCNVCKKQFAQTPENFHTLTQGKNKGQPSKSCRTCTEKYWRKRYQAGQAKKPRKPVQKVADIGLQSLSWSDRRDRDLERHRRKPSVRVINPSASHEAVRAQVEQLMQEYLDSGGQIRVIPAGQSGIAR